MSNCAIEAGTWADLLQVGNPLPLSDIIDLMDKLLDALQDLHDRGRLHLALSPGRICNGVEQVCFSKNTAESYASTLWYMAPEVRTRDMSRICYGSDLYSVCAILFQMLMGRPLREKEVLGRGMEEALNALAEIRPELSVQDIALLRSILRRGLHILPRRRFGSVEALRTQLHGLGADLTE